MVLTWCPQLVHFALIELGDEMVSGSGGSFNITWSLENGEIPVPLKPDFTKSDVRLGHNWDIRKGKVSFVALPPFVSY